MKVSPQEVARIAALARLGIDQDRLDAFAAQFNDILDYMALLGQVDTTGVEPLYSPVDGPTRLREDKAESRYSREEILASAPETDGAHFVVPKIV
ncbi:Asp-tRNA(Asn)/Glu-tRNA(Gln) amidotransferase subunit GatC [Desulfocurvus vexinensis]|uniref:Asp-tRNA(Asn)/Glu-tRNA(Gln) amidotransferase subunit GatC n=1 Tax=Desulfocurvus vexinensis TaxID=399548 RepID=UPI00048F0DF1|nr:Asp-tRNA(Asn)/Glu-tRNA(Gln) amidotransferase subunit GatC [Desulfocurvus vexinensis]